jgi:hypothetical protein
VTGSLGLSNLSPLIDPKRAREIMIGFNMIEESAVTIVKKGAGGA